MNTGKILKGGIFTFVSVASYYIASNVLGSYEPWEWSFERQDSARVQDVWNQIPPSEQYYSKPNVDEHKDVPEDTTQSNPINLENFLLRT